MKEAILGLGEEIKADDGIGKYVIDKLRKKKNRRLLLYYSVPENAFSRLRKEKIGKLTIIDAADFNGQPGEFVITKSFNERKRLSTHSTSVSKLAKYLKESIGIKDITVVLVQVKSLEFGGKMSEEVRKAGDKIAGLFS